MAKVAKKVEHTKEVKLNKIDPAQRKTLDFRAGDTVKVHQIIREKGKIRLQIFEGLILARKHGTEAGGTFTVRKVTEGVGVERIFPLYSPMIDKIEVIRRAKVRRAKLYYIRDKAAKEISRQMRNSKAIKSPVAVATEAEVEETPAEVSAE
jgi:large subunit ribosomal protein L19